MFNIKISDNKNLFNLFIIIFLISSCSSMNITEEVVYDSGISSVEAKMIEDSELDYETKAISLAKNYKEIEGLKKHLAQEKNLSKLFDSKVFTKDLEKIYKKIIK